MGGRSGSIRGGIPRVPSGFPRLPSPRLSSFVTGGGGPPGVQKEATKRAISATIPNVNARRIAIFRFILELCGLGDFPLSKGASRFSLPASVRGDILRDHTTYMIGINSVGGFSDTVSLALSGLPLGASATFSPSLLSGSGNSTLTVTTSRSVRRASFALTITGTSNGASGNHTHSTTVSLKTH